MKLPIRPKSNRDILDEDGNFVCFANTTADRDYIVQAINAYELMKEFIEETDNAESYREWCNCNKEAGEQK